MQGGSTNCKEGQSGMELINIACKVEVQNVQTNNKGWSYATLLASFNTMAHSLKVGCKFHVFESVQVLLEHTRMIPIHGINTLPSNQ